MENNTGFIVKRKNVKRYIIIMVVLLIAIMGLVYDVNTGYTIGEEDIIEGLSDSLIRFHVIAHSDLPEDQALKIKVKDAVIEQMRVMLEKSESKEDSREIILNNRDKIQLLAEQVIADNNKNYEARVCLESESFPLKTYGDVILPAGEYEALIIKIGEAKGKNWWCVLFPPLCFVDATHGIVDNESKEELKGLLSDEEYNAIIMSRDKDVDVKIKIRLFDWLKEKEEEILDVKMLANIFK